MNPTDSPTVLAGGGWYPRHGSPVLHWHPGANPPAWQDVSASRCGSSAGLERHRVAGQKPCDLCVAARAQYDRNRTRSRKGKAA